MSDTYDGTADSYHGEITTITDDDEPSASGVSTPLEQLMDHIVSISKVDTYTSAGPHTWNKHANAKLVRIILCGCGGDGAPGSGTQGGGGGGAAALFDVTYPAALVPASLTIDVGQNGGQQTAAQGTGFMMFGNAGTPASGGTGGGSGTRKGGDGNTDGSAAGDGADAGIGGRGGDGGDTANEGGARGIGYGAGGGGGGGSPGAGGGGAGGYGLGNLAANGANGATGAGGVGAPGVCIVIQTLGK